MFTQKFIKISNSVQKIGPFSLLINVILQFLGLDLFNIKLSAKFYQNIPNGLIVNFHFFKNLNLGKTSTNPKCHLTISWATSCQYTNVYAKFQNFITIFHSVLVNINVYANVYQNIPLSSRDRAIFTFSEFEPRQRLGQSQMTFDNLLGYILSISLRMQNFIKIFQTV